MIRQDVALIFRREVRDQLRDRRTLFMILVLPLLLYPMLGIGVASLSTAFEQKPRTLVIVGGHHLPATPPLLDPSREHLNSALFDTADDASRLRVKLENHSTRWSDLHARREALRRGEADAVLILPEGLGADLAAARTSDFTITFDSADERGPVAYRRTRDALEAWGDAVVRDRLQRDGRPPGYTRPLKIKSADVATPRQRGISVWARMFPFLLVTMALTGAFYPAIDLCAGEKERGTLETLLITPAGRGAIVLGKFLTVMLASAATALLNLLSMGLTGLQLGRQLGSGAPGLGPIFQAPSLEAAAWMVLVLVPLSALFAAVSVALASLAKGMKEGQYYMTPLYMATLPLTMLALAPGVELSLSTALLPIAGASLLLRSLIQGDYAQARHFVFPVLLTTLTLTALALRWAVAQFRGEDILSRESEKFEPAAWLRHLLRHKPPTPGVSAALLAFALILTANTYFAPTLGRTMIGTLVVGQVAFVMGIPLALALLFAAQPARTLRLRRPQLRDLAIGLILALAIHPLLAESRVWIEHLFPLSDTIKQGFAALTRTLPNLGTTLLLLAVLPAVCEEVAFRGYILTGLERGGSPTFAVAASALMFGMMHLILQQSLAASILGLILGLIALRSGSLFPGMLFHATNNALALTLANVANQETPGPLARALFRSPAEELFHPGWLALGATLTVLLLVVLIRGGGPDNEATDPEELANP